MTGTPSANSSVTGACSQTFYGTNTISVPGSITITDPGSAETTPTQALVGIGSSGLLVESNGYGQLKSSSNSVSVEEFQPFLGAGMGAIGLPKPSSAIDTSALTGAQYLGFIYEIGSASFNGSFNWSSVVASFGFPSLPSTCAAVAARTGTMIYGGDFPNNDPSSTTVQSTAGSATAMSPSTWARRTARTMAFSLRRQYIGKAIRQVRREEDLFVSSQSGYRPAQRQVRNVSDRSRSTRRQAWGIYLLQSN